MAKKCQSLNYIHWTDSHSASRQTLVDDAHYFAPLYPVEHILCAHAKSNQRSSQLCSNYSHLGAYCPIIKVCAIKWPDSGVETVLHASVTHGLWSNTVDWFLTPCVCCILYLAEIDIEAMTHHQSAACCSVRSFPLFAPADNSEPSSGGGGGAMATTTCDIDNIRQLATVHTPSGQRKTLVHI